MTTTADDPAARLELYLTTSDLADQSPTVTALTGDASDRQYFRIDAADGRRRVAAVHAGPIEFDELPFAIVSRLLEAMPVRAPRILDHDDDLGIVVQEDLGDVTLQARLVDATDAERTALYREAIDIIAVLQRRGSELEAPDLLPYQLAFDEDKLMFELRFFATHFLEAHRQAVIGDALREAIELEFSGIVSELAAETRVLCHRDFHSRNLMVQDGHLYVIDFQDARMGPNTYDLVSLLRDAYVDFEPEQVDELIGTFLTVTRAGTREITDFRRRFDLMAVQRTLKALGTFGFQATSRHNDSYLQNVPRTLGSLKSVLSAHPRFDRLRRHLGACVPELT